MSQQHMPPTRRIRGLSIGLVVIQWLANPVPAEELPTRPNIVCIVADDLGYRDVSFNGGEIPTPAIDRIAQEGVNLTQFYACPVCSPTRAGLMTGRWPLRMGIMRAVIPPWRKWGLPPAEHTLAELAAAAGYERRGIIGKWHLGHSSRKYHPLKQGFTYFYGHYNGAIDYWTHEREGEVDWHRNYETVHEPGYSTDLLGADAVRFIQGSPSDKPFLLYVPFNAPHGPYQAHEADVRRFEHFPNQRRRIYAAMVVAMDRAVAKILGALDDRGIADNTFVLFFSDNGGIVGHGDNGGLRGGKVQVYEGGTRVCAAARWPAGGIEGGKKVAGHMGYIDVYPTIKRIIGLADAADPNPLDGVDVWDAMRGEAQAPDREWFSYIHQSGTTEALAVIDPPYKLVVHGPGISSPDTNARSRVELFQIDGDPNEETNLAAEQSETVDRLIRRLRTFRSWKTDGVPAYSDGRKGFVAPNDWIIPD
jgi:arylsulfatase A-like enzyme